MRTTPALTIIAAAIALVGALAFGVAAYDEAAWQTRQTSFVVCQASAGYSGRLADAAERAGQWRAAEERRSLVRECQPPGSAWDFAKLAAALGAATLGLALLLATKILHRPHRA